MNVIDFYNAAKECNLLDESVADALHFVELFSYAKRKRGMCGYCNLRKTKDCPYPDDCKPAHPCCLSFKTDFSDEPE